MNPWTLRAPDRELDRLTNPIRREGAIIITNQCIVSCRTVSVPYPYRIRIVSYRLTRHCSVSCRIVSLSLSMPLSYRIRIVFVSSHEPLYRIVSCCIVSYRIVPCCIVSLPSSYRIRIVSASSRVRVPTSPRSHVTPPPRLHVFTSPRLHAASQQLL